MKEHIYNAIMFDNMLTDRTALDGIVYTTYLYNTEKVSPPTFIECYRMFEKLIPMYDYIFYIKPEFELEDDGVRSADIEWQDQIATMFERYIETEKVPVVNVSGSVRERVNTILKTIGEIK